MSGLQEVAAAADAVADEQRTVARTARQMQRARDRGVPWSAILDHERFARVVGLMRRGAQHLRATSTDLASLLAKGLAAEGESRRRIAHRLGVSHQRVTSILRSKDGHAAAAD